MDLGSSLGAIRKYTLLLPKFDQKEIMKRINHNDLTHYFIAIYDKKVKQLPISYIKSCNKFIEENSIAAQIYRSTPIREWRKARKDFEENGYPWLKIKKATSRKPQAASDLTLVPRYYRMNSRSRFMLFRSINLPNHTLALGGIPGPAQQWRKHEHKRNKKR